MILLLLGCTGPADRETASPEPDAPFGVLADHIAGGALLAAWSDGDVVRMVGGQLDKSGGLMVEYDGTTLCTDDSFPTTLWWIAGRAPGDYWMVGATGTILHVDASGTSDESVATESTLYGVHDDGTRVWAVGGDPFANTGEIWVREAGAWRLHTSTVGTVFKVWDGWFVGRGLLWRLEGESFVDYTPADAPTLLTVRGTGDDVWAVGGDASPVVQHWDGAAWSPIAPDPYCASRPLNGVWSEPGSTVWFAGMFGNVGGRDGSTWICPEYPPTQEHLHAAWQHGDEALFVGGNLFRTTDNYGTILRHPAPAAPLTASPCAR